MVEKGRLMSETLDMSEQLFHPDTFLNALRQETAGDTKTSMDNLKFVCRWNGTISGTKKQIKVGGLQLDGCTFDGAHLSENQRNSPSVCTVPTCNMAWVPKSAEDVYSTGDSISLPVYFSEEREKIVANLKLPCPSSEKDKWIQTGSALFLKKQ